MSFHHLEVLKSNTMRGHNEEWHTPGDVRELARVLKEVVTSAGKQRAVGKVEEVCEGDFITRKILLLGENLLIAGELTLELRGKVLDEILVSGKAELGRTDLLEDNNGGEGVKIGNLDGDSLLEEGRLPQVGSGQKRGRGLACNVESDGTGLIENEAIVILQKEIAKVFARDHAHEHN
jgi:hypothetical protein